MFDLDRPWEWDLGMGIVWAEGRPFGQLAFAVVRVGSMRARSREEVDL